MAISKKGLLAGLAGLGLLGVGVFSLLKKKDVDTDYELEDGVCESDEDEVEDIEEA